MMVRNAFIFFLLVCFLHSTVISPLLNLMEHQTNDCLMLGADQEEKGNESVDKELFIYTFRVLSSMVFFQRKKEKASHASSLYFFLPLKKIKRPPQGLPLT